MGCGTHEKYSSGINQRIRKEILGVINVIQIRCICMSNSHLSMSAYYSFLFHASSGINFLAFCYQAETGLDESLKFNA